MEISKTIFAGKKMIDPSFSAIHWWPGDKTFWSFSSVNVGMAIQKVNQQTLYGTVSIRVMRKLIKLMTSFEFESQLDATESHEEEKGIGAIRSQGERWYYFALEVQTGDVDKFVSLANNLADSFQVRKVIMGI